MGDSIHYQMRARDEAAVTAVLEAAVRFARREGWQIEQRDEADGELELFDPETEDVVTERGRVRGVDLGPHPECEPLMIEFGPSLRASGDTKTQFAPFEVHVKIVELLRQLGPLLAELHVDDETGFWETGDRKAAEAHMAATGAMIRQVRTEPGSWWKWIVRRLRDR